MRAEKVTPRDKRPETIAIGVRFPKSDLEAIDRIADRFDMSRAHVIRVAIKEFLHSSVAKARGAE